jgi:uncharacterized membrane protein (UPF0127 family)
VIVMLSAQLFGCSEHRLETTTIEVEGHSVEVEIAELQKERERGLMGRKDLGPDQGMLFMYRDERPRSFWMKDTPLPLSIAYADRKGTIVKILDMEPYSEAHYQSIYPAMYALEMKQGWFQQNDVVPGDRLTHLPTVKAE